MQPSLHGEVQCCAAENVTYVLVHRVGGHRPEAEYQEPLDCLNGIRAAFKGPQGERVDFCSQHSEESRVALITPATNEDEGPEKERREVVVFVGCKGRIKNGQVVGV